MKTARNLTVLGIGLSVSAVVGWLLLKENKRTKELPTLTIKSQNRAKEPETLPKIVLPLDSLEAEDPVPDIAASKTTQVDTKTTPDDLTRIKDIGPRYAEALQAIGILSYAQLAQQTPEALSEQLAPHVSVRAERIRDRNWIGQAAQLAKR